MVQIGDMRHRVEIQHPLETQTTTGETSRSWKCLANVWAKVQPLSAKERLAAQAAEVEDTHKVTIRYRDGVDAKNRIVWKHNELTKTLEITGVIDQMARERYLILMCTEAV